MNSKAPRRPQEAAQANVRIAQEKLGYTELHAEFDGVVAATKAEVGQVVQPGQEVVHVVRPEEREAVVDVPDQYRGQTFVRGPASS